MNQMQLLNPDNGKKMSSREIAELTGKMHKHVLVDCDKLNETYASMGMAEISSVNYTADNGQAYREYKLTKIQSLDLMTGYRTDLRIKVNHRWEELETEKQRFKLPQTFSDALRLAADKEEENQRLLIDNREKDRLLEEQAPAVLFKQSVEGASTNISVEHMAKILNQNGVDIGQNRLFDWFVNSKYLIRHKRWSKKKGKYIFDYTQTQKAADLKVFFITETTINPAAAESFIKHTIKVTGKGQVYFVNKFLNNNQ